MVRRVGDGVMRIVAVFCRRQGLWQACDASTSLDAGAAGTLPQRGDHRSLRVCCCPALCALCALWSDGALDICSWTCAASMVGMRPMRARPIAHTKEIRDDGSIIEVVI